MAFHPDRYADLSGFRFALRRFLAASEAINREAGVTQQQYQAMLAVRAWSGEAMAMKDLAEELMLTHHAAVQLVDRLAKQELVERRPSRDDRRVVWLQLTAKGSEMLSDLAVLHLDELRRQEPLLSHSLGRIRNSGR